MSPGEKAALERGSSKAGQIAALCRFMSDALGADPDTASASDALDGVEALALTLSNDLLNMVEVAA